MGKKFSAWVILALAFAVASPLAWGQEASATVKVRWTILPFASLSVAGEKGTTVQDNFSLPDPTTFDLERGYMEFPGALALVVTSNTQWWVGVRALEPNMGKSHDGTYTKPLSDFKLRANGGSYQTVGRTSQMIANGQQGMHTLFLDYQVLLDPKLERSGDYGLTLIYTITTS
jgi:hypothetical protein